MTSKTQKKIVFRKNYQPLSWTVKSVFLNFNINDNNTVVSSKLFFRKNNKTLKNNSFLILNGKDLITDDLFVILDNSKIRKINVNSVLIDQETLKIKIPKSTTKVILKSKVKIFPNKNFSLEGLYESNKMICSQCEPEGFRKITWFPDRPDNLSIFTVRIEASYNFKYLLSNGNLIKKGKNKKSKTQFVIWKDPIPKSSYLFALVAGNLDKNTDNFITKSNKKITLDIFTDIGNAKYSKFALKSLKRAMKWEEKKYGLEYDLDKYMIVAVDHFNMGAMENKGLNLFNSKYILSDPKISTDADLINIESIIAHEYFHNWTGNRVTCRDWFQLTLKEGLTVLRDQQFTESLHHKSVKRIEDVSLLRNIQFPEDRGTNKHSIRPNQYLEINNFYTPTIYEKGAEVIRMICTFMGEKNFIEGVKFYLKSFDGKAATCEDFVKSLEISSNMILNDFYKWYDQVGLVNLNITRSVNKKNNLVINLAQNCKNYNYPLPILIKLSFINENGKFIKFKINNNTPKKEQTYLFNKKKAKLTFNELDTKAVPSLLRNFSAPVNMTTDLKPRDYLHLLKYDDDDFNKWDAAQSLHLHYFHQSKMKKFTDNINLFLKDDKFDINILSLIIKPPSIEEFYQSFKRCCPIEIYKKKNLYKKTFFKQIEKNAEYWILKALNDKSSYKFSIDQKALFSTLLPNLCFIGNQKMINIAYDFTFSKEMTIKIIGLNSFLKSKNKKGLYLLDKFYRDFSNNQTVVEKWFSMMASYNLKNNGLKSVKSLLCHEKFDYKNPNLVRAVLGSFQKNNIEIFHSNDGTGYQFVSEQVIKIDKINPQISARIILPLTRYSNYRVTRQNMMKKYLKKIMNEDLSKDLFEIITKALD